MPAETINERVAVLEFQIDTHENVIKELRVFKEDMLAQISELKSSINLLTWKVGLVVGGTFFIANQLVIWVFNRLLK